jgi:signal transduction histidine kinase
MSVTVLWSKAASRALSTAGGNSEQAKNATLAERYWEILQAYLADGSEASLSRGYELARQAMVEGCGVLELAEIHDTSLRRLRAESRTEDRLLRATSAFFAECLSPFEMSHRGAQEGARALRHLNEVLESELKRIAHVLHDQAGQLLASVHIAVVDVANEVPPQARTRFEKVEQLLAQVEAELRNLSHEWRPTVLDNLGLLPALEFLAENVAKRTGIPVIVTGEAGTDVRLPGTVETALYRIVQEALNNAIKHAAARSVWIELQYLPYLVTCSVRDDGRGFDAGREPKALGLGLTGIRERVNALGGSLRLVTTPLNGTTLQASIPLGD